MMNINGLVISDSLDKDKDIEMEIVGIVSIYLDEEEAIKLMNHLAKVFQLDSSNFDLEGEC